MGRLQRIKPRHRDIMRRMIVGQTAKEISIELGMSQSRISVLLDDPLFQSTMEELQTRVEQEFVQSRATAMQVLEATAPMAALACHEVVTEGTLDGEKVGAPLRLKSAWDVLDRTGNKAAEKRLVGTVDLGDLIADAYQKKHGKAYEKAHDGDQSTPQDREDASQVGEPKLIEMTPEEDYA